VLHCVLLLLLPAANVKNLFCDSCVHVLCVASWWPAGMLVHYVTSHFMENRNLFVVGHVKFEFIACLQLGKARQAALSVTGESVYRCDACAKSLGSSSSVKAPSKSPESLHHPGAMSCASSNEEASSLISVSTQLEAVQSNGQCTTDLVQFLINMVTNLTKEVTHSWS
jgi:hypothetical protein